MGLVNLLLGSSFSGTISRLPAWSSSTKDHAWVTAVGYLADPSKASSSQVTASGLVAIGPVTCGYCNCGYQTRLDSIPCPGPGS